MKFKIVFIFFSLLMSQFGFSQSHFHLDNYYQSPTDKLITIKSIAVLPFTDNTKGIYSKPFHAYVKNYIDENPKWNLENIEIIGRIPYVSDLERDSNQVLNYSKGINVDAFISGRVTRTENSVNITLALFLAKDGLLFAKEEIKNITQAGLKKLNSPFKQALYKLFKQLPYDGMILSRKDKLVTLNLSKSDGIINGQDLTVASIIKLKRHPRFNFLINSEKTILGKLRVKKVDESLTFAEIIVEKEKGSIQKNAKIVGSHLASFSNNNVISTQATSNYNPGSNIQGGVTAAPRWKPTLPPSYGRAEVTIGAGLLKKDSGNAFSEKNIITQLALDGEVWVNDKWSVHSSIDLGLAKISDPDSQANLSVNTSSFELLGGYNFRMGGAYDTKFEVLAGYSRFSSSIENPSPTKFTSLRYSGIKIGADVITPFTPNKDILGGASLFFLLKPKLKERPNASGTSSDNSGLEFKLYGLKKWKENFYIKGMLKYNNYSTSFANQITASSIGERNTSFNLGINYFF